jgi:hypothetical protein
MAFDDRAEGFEEVEGEAVTVLLVGVNDPEPRVQAEGDGGEPAFGFGERVAIVEECVDWVGGFARGAATGVQSATAGSEDAPMIPDPVSIPFSEAAVHVGGPGAEVGVAGQGFNLAAGHQIGRRSQVGREVFDPVRHGGSSKLVRRDLGLPLQLGTEQRFRDVDPNVTEWGGGLGAAQPGIIAAGLPRHGQEPVVAVELHDGDPNIGAPTDRFEAQVAGVTDDHQPSQFAFGPAVATCPAMLADPVVDKQVAAVDANGQAVSVGDGDTPIGGVAVEQVGDGGAIL